MSDNKGDIGDDIAAGCAAVITGLLVGIFFGWWEKQQQKKKEQERQLHFPDVLEINYDGPIYVPVSQRPWYVRYWRAIAFIGVYAVLVFGSLGVSGLTSSSAGGCLGGLVCFAIGAYIGYWVIQLRAKKEAFEIEPVLPRPDALDLSKARMYTITLPKSTDWQPDLAGRFMEHILHKVTRITFQIVAEPGQLSWRIVDLRRGLDPSVIQQAVNDFYPDAHVEVSPVSRQSPALPFYRYVMAFEQLWEPLLPIAYVDMFTQGDPLVHLTHEMCALKPGERVTYTLFVADSASYIYDQVRELLTVEQPQNPFSLLSPQGWVEAGHTLTTSQAQLQPAYDPDLEQKVTTKLTNLVYQCLLLIQIDAPTKERVQDLSRLESHLLQFKNFPYNALAWHEEPWPESIRYVDTPEREWATSTFGLLDGWLTNTSREWQSFRLLLDTKELAALWHLPHKHFSAPAIAWAPKRVRLPQKMRGFREGVFLGANHCGGHIEPVCMPDEDRATHINILGMTGVGKSTLLHHLIHQDILNNQRVAVIDPHGQLVRDILQTSIPPTREDDVVVLDLANEAYPPPLNPMGGVHSRAAVTRIISILDKIYGGWENAPRMANALSSALVTLRAEPNATVRDVARLFLDEAYRARLLAATDDEVAIEFWEHEFENFSEGQRQQIRDPVVYRMRTFYGNRDLYPVMCHPDTLDFARLIREGRIILVSLGMDEERIPERERNLLGAVLVSQLQMAAMGAASSEAPFYLYIDEVQNFVTSSLSEVFSEARKFGLSLVVANQYLKQLAGETLDALMGNVGAMIVFQCGLDDARALAPYMSPEFEAEDLLNLGKYQAVVKLRFQGVVQPAFSLTGREPLQKPPDAEARERRIRERSVQQYTPKTRGEVMAWLAERYPRKKRLAPIGPDETFSDPLE